MSSTGYGAVSGPTSLNIVPVSADYTAQAGDELIQVTTGSGNVNVKLPAPTAAITTTQAAANPVLGVGGVYNAGQVIRIMKVDTGAGHVIIDGVLPQYIRAGGKVTLNSNDSSATFVSDGTFWSCLGTVS